jgi:ATP-dependent Zn protease
MLARRTTGFTPAEIENVVNQAALKAATDGQVCVPMQCLWDAHDRVLMGRERKGGRLLDEQVRVVHVHRTQSMCVRRRTA